MFWTYIVIAFFGGILFAKLFSGLLTLGYSALLMKQVHDDGLKIMGIICQELAEIHQLKLMELHRAGKSETEIEISQKVSDYHLDSVRKTIVRNFVSSFPNNYSSILKFYDWESAMVHLDELIKEERNKKLKS
tara:strand:- start:113 stop:511 length:399 start_codon:yes stop_codon:yes gene_type:complete